MLKDPKIKLYNEMDRIMLEVEDEGTVVKIDIDDKIVELITETNEKKMKELLKRCNENNRHEELNS